MPRVLIASDNYDAALDLEAELNGAGLDVVAVETTARSTLDAANREHPTVALVNSMLRSGSGEPVAGKLLSMGVDVLLTTGNGAQFRGLRKLGNFMCLRRPFDVHRAVLALRRLEKQHRRAPSPALRTRAQRAAE